MGGICGLASVRGPLGEQVLILSAPLSQLCDDTLIQRNSPSASPPLTRPPASALHSGHWAGFRVQKVHGKFSADAVRWVGTGTKAVCPLLFKLGQSHTRTLSHSRT